MSIKEASAAIDAAMKMLPERMDSPEARVMLYAIGLQESRFIYRRQIGGPARGFWQFERGGGVAGVMRHSSSKSHAKSVCEALGVAFDVGAVYNTLEHDDVLAAAFARLLLWTDPFALPRRGDADAAWDLYLRVWRPGRPHRHTWDALYAKALASV